MNKIILPLLVVGVIVGVVAVVMLSNRNKAGTQNTESETVYEDQNGVVPKGTSAPQTNVATLAIPLLPVGESTQSGRVELTEKSGNVELLIEITDGALPSQSAAVRLGNCPTPGEVAFNLKDLVSGKSTSTIEKSMAELVPELPMAVVISNSANSTSYTSCGDLALPSSSN